MSYDDVHGDNVVTLDSNDGILVYDQSLRREPLMNLPAWRAIVGDDEDGRKLLQEYSQIIYEHGIGGDAMGFFVRRRPEHSELRSLLVMRGYGSSSCSTFGFRNSGSFLRVCQRRTLEERGRLSLCGTAGELSLIKEEGTLTLTKE